MHPNRGRLTLEFNRVSQLERKALTIRGRVGGLQPYQLTQALPRIERPDMAVGWELESLSHADVIGRDALPWRNLGVALDEHAKAEDQGYGEGAEHLHVPCSSLLLFRSPDHPSVPSRNCNP